MVQYYTQSNQSGPKIPSTDGLQRLTVMLDDMAPTCYIFSTRHLCKCHLDAHVLYIPYFFPCANATCANPRSLCHQHKGKNMGNITRGHPGDICTGAAWKKYNTWAPNQPTNGQTLKTIGWGYFWTTLINLGVILYHLLIYGGGWSRVVTLGIK